MLFPIEGGYMQETVKDKLASFVQVLLCGVSAYFGLTYASSNPSESRLKRNVASTAGVLSAVAGAVQLWLMFTPSRPDKAAETPQPKEPKVDAKRVDSPDRDLTVNESEKNWVKEISTSANHLRQLSR